MPYIDKQQKQTIHSKSEKSMIESFVLQASKNNINQQKRANLLLREFNTRIIKY